MNRYKTMLFFSIYICSVCSVVLKAQSSDSIAGRTYGTTGFREKLFSSDQPLEVWLRFDLSKFLKSKKDPVFMDAACAIVWESDTFERNVKIKARGEMRRAYCQLPPVLLKFGEKSDDFPLNGSLKLVVPCFPTGKYENYVLKEFLVYRLFNHVTPYSLKTRLVRITITDEGKSGKNYTAYGFLIENEKRMAERTNAIILKNPNLTQHHMKPDDMARIALFNYMVGNTDWSVPMQHNIRILKPDTLSGKAIPVAFDFDYAGFVNPPYAVPAKELPITEIKDRYYMGMCNNSESLKSTISEFELLKEDFLSTIENFEYLSEQDKKYSESYIENFFRMYKNRNAMFNAVNRTCKQ